MVIHFGIVNAPSDVEAAVNNSIRRLVVLSLTSSACSAAANSRGLQDATAGHVGSVEAGRSGASLHVDGSGNGPVAGEAADQNFDDGFRTSGEQEFLIMPASCSKEDVVSRLQSSSARDCGDLELDPTSMLKADAVACIEAAVAESRPFTVFWRERGADDVLYKGVIGRIEGNGLTFWTLSTGSGAFFSDIPGATTSWFRCELGSVNTACDARVSDCFPCGFSGDSICGCLPAGERPGAPPGDGLEVKCEKH